MRAFEAVGVVLLGLLLILLGVFVRREIIVRGGTIDMSIRVNTLLPQRGWAPGLGRFVGDELRWYRVFSFSVRPKHVLTRNGLTVSGRRAPAGEERMALAEDWVIVHCKGKAESVDIALAESTLTGFLSWLEAAPPGALHQRL